MYLRASNPNTVQHKVARNPFSRRKRVSPFADLPVTLQVKAAIFAHVQERGKIMAVRRRGRR
jgi:hypothetical protein